MATPIIQRSLLRIAWVFYVRVEDIDFNMRFGTDLKASFVSDFSENELDQIAFDVQEMREGIGNKNGDKNEVETVGDFCALMENFQAVNYAGCCRLLKRWEKEVTVSKKPQWRRFLFKLIGL